MMKRSTVFTLFVLGVAALLVLPLGASVKEGEGLTEADKGLIAAELERMGEREAQSVCPLTGGPVAEGQGHQYMGYFIGTCCGNCAAKVSEDPLAAIKALRDRGQEPQLAEGLSAQTTCPAMPASEIDEEVFAVKSNLLVRFCCPGCEGGFNEDPAGTAESMIEAGQAPIILTLEQTLCPVSGHQVNPEVKAMAAGKWVALCCEGCAAPVQANGESVLRILADKGVYVPSDDES